MHKRRLPIFITKMRKPMVAKLIFLKKVKRFQLLKHYNNYGFLQEHQFSASSTPLLYYHRRVNYMKNVGSSQDFYSMFFFCKCFRGSAEAADYCSPLWSQETLPPGAVNGGGGLEVEPLDLENEEYDDSVDEKVEKFTECFYEEMRKQRQESI